MQKRLVAKTAPGGKDGTTDGVQGTSEDTRYSTPRSHLRWRKTCNLGCLLPVQRLAEDAPPDPLRFELATFAYRRTATTCTRNRLNAVYAQFVSEIWQKMKDYSIVTAILAPLMIFSLSHPCGNALHSTLYSCQGATFFDKSSQSKGRGTIHSARPCTHCCTSRVPQGYDGNEVSALPPR